MVPKIGPTTSSHLPPQPGAVRGPGRGADIWGVQNLGKELLTPLSTLWGKEGEIFPLPKPREGSSERLTCGVWVPESSPHTKLGVGDHLT